MSFKTSIAPYHKTPKMLVKSPRLTIRQIAAKVPQVTRLKSRKVGVEKVWEGNVPRALEGYTCYRFQTQNTLNGNQYRLAIYSPTPKVTLDSKVIIDSPNPLHVFKYEYALAKRGNAFIYRSNGDAPVQTNPRLIPGIDHHVYRALQYLIKNTTKNGLREPEITPARVRRTRREAR
jgi:hypothetical protein